MANDISKGDDKPNPFYRASWDQESWDLTEDRMPDLKKLFGLNEVAIRRLGSNNGEYVAFKAIKEKLAKMSGGFLLPDIKWRAQHPDYGKK